MVTLPADPDTLAAAALEADRPAGCLPPAEVLARAAGITVLEASLRIDSHLHRGVE